MSVAKNIMVVDDEISIARFLRELLESRGYAVTIEGVSDHAFNIFKQTPQKFDLLITDQTMPGLTGLQLAEKILSIREDFPIILCTGYSEVANENKATASGIKGFLAKPIDHSKMLNLIHELLAENQLG